MCVSVCACVSTVSPFAICRASNCGEIEHRIQPHSQHHHRHPHSTHERDGWRVRTQKYHGWSPQGMSYRLEENCWTPQGMNYPQSGEARVARRRARCCVVDTRSHTLCHTHRRPALSISRFPTLTTHPAPLPALNHPPTRPQRPPG